MPESSRLRRMTRATAPTTKMPGYISLQDQGYFSPAQVIQESVRQSIAAQMQRQRMEEEQKQFGTEQATREAEAAPNIDPNVVRQRVIKQQGLARGEAADANTAAGLPFWQRQALAKGHLPTSTATTSSLGPGGATTTETQTQLPGAPDAQGNPTMQPFGGNKTVSAPQTRTVTKILPPGPGQPATPGLAMVQTDSYVLKDPTQPDTEANRVIVDSKQTPQRTTPARGDAAILQFATDLGLDPDDVADMVKGMVNKKSATAPSDPNAMKPTAEWAQNNVNLVKLKAQLRQTEDEDTRANLQDQITKLETRNKFLSTPKKNSADIMDKFLNGDGNDQPDPSGTTTGSQMPPEQAGKIAAARAAQPSDAATGGPPNPQKPATSATAKPVAKPASTQYVDGKVYKDASGKRAKWSAAENKFVPVAAGQ